MRVDGLPCSRPLHRRGVAQPGRAPGSGPGGRRFKSSLPDQSFVAMPCANSSVGPSDQSFHFRRPERRNGLARCQQLSALDDISSTMASKSVMDQWDQRSCQRQSWTDGLQSSVQGSQCLATASPFTSQARMVVFNAKVMAGRAFSSPNFCAVSCRLRFSSGLRGPTGLGAGRAEPLFHLRANAIVLLVSGCPE